MAYVGNPIDTQNTFQSLVGKRFNGDGSTTAFTLDVAPSSTLDIEVFVGNVRQDPNSAYTLSGTTLTFTGAPPSGTNNIYVVHQAKSVGTIDVPSSFLSTEQTFTGGLDINGTELKLDADADTSITADTDDQIDIKIAGADDFQFTANTFTAQSGSTITTPTLGVGNTKDLGAGIHIKIADTGASANSSADELVIEGTSTVGMSFLTNNDQDSNITFGDSDNNERGRIQYAHDGNFLAFYTNGAEKFRIEQGGNILIGTTSTDLNDANDEGSKFDPDGTNQIATTGTPLDLNQSTADTGQRDLIQFNRNGSVPGAISATPSTVSYGTFMGVHWSRFSDNSKPTILEGTVMESIDEICDWYVAEFTADKPRRREIAKGSHSIGDDIKYTFNGVEYDAKVALEIDDERLPKSKVSDTEDSKKVYGVFHAWREGQVENDFSVASLGAYVVRMHKDETVVNGDYVQSKGDGTAKKQSDDILKSSTIGKITSATKIKTYADGSYLVPCVLHCG